MTVYLLRLLALLALGNVAAMMAVMLRRHNCSHCLHVEMISDCKVFNRFTFQADLNAMRIQFESTAAESSQIQDSQILDDGYAAWLDVSSGM